MAKEQITMSVVTLPLKTEKWQEDRLVKLFELFRQTYNAMVSITSKNYRKLLLDERYYSTKEYINEIYKTNTGSDLKEVKKTKEFKDAAKQNQDVLKEYGFTEYGFIKLGTFARQHYEDSLPSACVNGSLAKPLWAAYEKLLYGNGDQIHYKKYGSFNSICADGKSGIRIIGEDGQTIFTRGNNKNLYVRIGSSKRKYITIPVMIPKNDYYKQEMLNRNWKIVRIVKKQIKGKVKFLLQLTVSGSPADKIDLKTGEVKHPLGNGKVGIYIDTTSVTCALESGDILSFDLSQGINVFEEKNQI